MSDIPDKMTVSDTNYFAHKGEFVTRDIAGETILVPVRGRKGDLDSIYNLNEVAAFIWKRIDGRTTLAQVVEQVCCEFDIEPGAARNDALRFIAVLQEAELIEVAPGKGA